LAPILRLWHFSPEEVRAMGSVGAGVPTNADALTRVLILDRHRMLAESLRSALATFSDRFVVCGPVSDIVDGLRACGDRRPDLVLLGLHRGGQLERITEVRGLADHHPDLRFLVISDAEDESEAIDMYEAGAIGFITSMRPLGDLVGLIDGVLAGRPLVLPEGFPSMLRSASMRRGRAEELRRRMASLTPREREVLELMSAGLGDAEIASRLFISPRTVETHVHTLIRKLGAGSRLQAVVLRLRPDDPGVEHATAS
jgi:DNA-binding NarL/FixJ family response regulator